MPPYQFRVGICQRLTGLAVFLVQGACLIKAAKRDCRKIPPRPGASPPAQCAIERLARARDALSHTPTIWDQARLDLALVSLPVARPRRPN